MRIPQTRRTIDALVSMVHGHLERETLHCTTGVAELSRLLAAAEQSGLMRKRCKTSASQPVVRPSTSFAVVAVPFGLKSVAIQLHTD